MLVKGAPPVMLLSKIYHIRSSPLLSDYFMGQTNIDKKSDNCHAMIQDFIKATRFEQYASVQWRHNERDDVSNHQPDDCLHNLLFKRRPKKTSKLLVPGLCQGNSPVTGEFPKQRTSNAENVPFDDVILLCGIEETRVI